MKFNLYLLLILLFYFYVMYVINLNYHHSNSYFINLKLKEKQNIKKNIYLSHDARFILIKIVLYRNREQPYHQRRQLIYFFSSFFSIFYVTKQLIIQYTISKLLDKVMVKRAKLSNSSGLRPACNNYEKNKIFMYYHILVFLKM